MATDRRQPVTLEELLRALQEQVCVRMQADFQKELRHILGSILRQPSEAQRLADEAPGLGGAFATPSGYVRLEPGPGPGPTDDVDASRARRPEAGEEAHLLPYSRTGHRRSVGRSLMNQEVFREFADHEDMKRDDVCDKSREPLREFILSDLFSYLSTALIVINVLSIGVETDYMAEQWVDRPPLAFKIVERVFCIVFVLELGLRIYASGRNFFSMAGWKWNVMDCVLVSFQLLEQAVSVFADNLDTAHKGSLKQFSVIRIMRLFRLIRILRIFRTARVLLLVGELRTIVNSIGNSFKTLFWALVLFLILTYTIGIYLTEVVTEHKVAELARLGREGRPSKEEEPVDADLQRYFGSLGRSMLTLYEAYTEGLAWDTMMVPLRDKVSPWLELLFVLYMAFTLFALVNAITGVFVDSALRTAADDQKEIRMKQLKDLFQPSMRLEEGRQVISYDDYEMRLEQPQAREVLKSIGLDRATAKDLFLLLSRDGKENGEPIANLEDLVVGALRLCGSVTALDFATFERDWAKWQLNWVKHARSLEHALGVREQRILPSRDRL